MSLPLRAAGSSDLPAIVALMNSAFRGVSREPKAWSTEAEYIAGSRTTELLVAEEMASGVEVLVVDGEAGLDGCVSVKELSAGPPMRWYLGSLAVMPALQNSGLGRRLLEAAEERVAVRGAEVIEMTVVNVRDTLLAWYERRGYRLTGETRAFPYGDTRFGTPLRDDLQFVVLEKRLALPEAWAGA